MEISEVHIIITVLNCIHVCTPTAVLGTWIMVIMWHRTTTCNRREVPVITVNYFMSAAIASKAANSGGGHNVMGAA